MRGRHPCILNLQSSGNKITRSFWGRSLIFWKVMVIRRRSRQLEKGKCHTHLPEEQRREPGKAGQPLKPLTLEGLRGKRSRRPFSQQANEGPAGRRWTRLGGVARLPPTLPPQTLADRNQPRSRPPSGGARRGAARGKGDRHPRRPPGDVPLAGCPPPCSAVPPLTSGRSDPTSPRWCRATDSGDAPSQDGGGASVSRDLSKMVSCCRRPLKDGGGGPAPKRGRLGEGPRGGERAWCGLGRRAGGLSGRAGGGAEPGGRHAGAGGGPGGGAPAGAAQRRRSLQQVGPDGRGVRGAESRSRAGLGRGPWREPGPWGDPAREGSRAVRGAARPGPGTRRAGRRGPRAVRGAARPGPGRSPGAAIPVWRRERGLREPPARRRRRRCFRLRKKKRRRWGAVRGPSAPVLLPAEGSETTSRSLKQEWGSGGGRSWSCSWVSGG